MAGIIEGPFRYIVAIPHANVATRKMGQYIIPARRAISQYGVANGGPGAGDTYSYYEEVILDQAHGITDPVTATFDRSERVAQGDFQVFRVNYLPLDFNKLIGYRITANGALVGAIGLLVVSGGNIDLLLRPEQVSPSADVQVEFYTLDNRVNPPLVPTYIRIGDEPPFDYAAEKAVIQAMVTDGPDTLPTLAGDGAFATDYDLFQEFEAEDPRPEYSIRKNFEMRRKAVSERGLYWAVGKMVVSGTSATVTGRVLRDPAGGRLPFDTMEPPIVYSNNRPVTVSSATASPSFSAAPRAVSILNVGGDAVFRVTLTDDSEHDVLTLPMPNLSGVRLADRLLDISYLQLADEESFDYSVGAEQGFPSTVYWSELACEVVGTYGSDQWP